MITDPDIATILGYVLLLPPTGGWFALRFSFPYSPAFYSVVNEKETLAKPTEWPEWAR